MAKITQKVLATILKKRAAIDAAEKQLKELEYSLMERLKAGAALQPGLLQAEIKSWERRSPQWKEIAIREIDKIRGDGEGTKFAEKVLAATKAQKYEKLVVELIA